MCGPGAARHPSGAAHFIAFHRGEDGAWLPPRIDAIEMLNILRPTVAIARFMTLAALALHQHPDSRDWLAADDAHLETFVQEVRRTSPFFPIVAGVARGPFAWRDVAFQAGDRFVLDFTAPTMTAACGTIPRHSARSASSAGPATRSRWSRRAAATSITAIAAPASG